MVDIDEGGLWIRMDSSISGRCQHSYLPFMALQIPIAQLQRTFMSSFSMPYLHERVVFFPLSSSWILQGTQFQQHGGNSTQKFARD